MEVRKKYDRETHYSSYKLSSKSLDVKKTIQHKPVLSFTFLNTIIKLRCAL